MTGDGLRIDATIAVGELEIRLDLAVGRGETVALVGPNGAGKSTVLRAICGLHPIGSGRITFDGAMWDDPSSGTFVQGRSRRVGVVFQQYLLFDHLTALDNVGFGLQACGIDRAAARRSAQALLERLGVAGVGDRRPPSLSGGQAQRVALARALVIEPALLLLDEPLSALDASTRGGVRNDLARRLREARAADGAPPARVVVTHDPVDAHALADRVVVLEHGVVTRSGSMAELAASPGTRYVADLIGTNLFHGLVNGSTFTGDGGTRFTVGPHEVADGPAVATIRPAAVTLHRSEPAGSARNVWSAVIDGVDHSADRVRVRLGGADGVVAEVTGAGYDALDLGGGDVVWASVKASEISVGAG
ncbi:MAG: ABC transporter ATP-binding protein [Ilumatobacteraceae bacterium]